MLLLLSLVAIVCLIVLIAAFKMDTFISFLLVSVGLGLAVGMPVTGIVDSIQKGIGATLGELVMVIGFGAMLGRLVADSGAAQKITEALIKVFGKKYIQWGMTLAGFIIGIPLFYNAGFVIVVPLIFMIASTTGLPILYIGIPLLAALSVAHGYLPPHPSPAAIATEINANIGKTLFYGIIVAIPAIALAGPVFARTLKKYNPKPDSDLFSAKVKDSNELPGLGISIFSALLPVFLLLSMSALHNAFPKNSFIQLLANPSLGMLVSTLSAIYFLGIRRGKKMKQITLAMEDAFKGVSVILLIIAGSGVFKQILTDSGVNSAIANGLKGFDIPPLILSWGIAAIIRVCVGSATVAGLTTVGILSPMFHQIDTPPELIVLAIGSGSLMFSHLNDGGFWLFKEYFNLSIKETILTWSIMETIVSVVGLIGVLILNVFL